MSKGTVKIPNNQVLEGKPHRDARMIVRCDDHYDKDGRQCILEKYHEGPHQFVPHQGSGWPFPTGGFGGGEG